MFYEGFFCRSIANSPIVVTSSRARLAWTSTIRFYLDDDGRDGGVMDNDTNTKLYFGS